MGDRYQAFIDREDRRATIEAMETKKHPRTTLFRGKFGIMAERYEKPRNKYGPKRKYVECECGKISNLNTIKSKHQGKCPKCGKGVVIE